jgi:SNF2 family DNA or RNA helicase
MLSQNLLSDKQDRAITRLIEHDETILISSTGSGKTVICLSAMAELREMGEGPFIVACPAKVVPNWDKESFSWDHLDVQVCTLDGDAKSRAIGLKQSADVYVVSLNNLDWLLQQDHGCKGIVVDELSKAAGKQTAKLRTKKYGSKIKWRVGMTGTPVSQNFQNLFGQVRVVDNGKALGNNKQKYMDKYFYSDYMGFNWTLHDWAGEAILNKIRPLVHHIENTKSDDLPRLYEKTIPFDMSMVTHSLYKEMKKNFVVEGVVAANAAVQSGKLRQLGSGFLYDEDGKIHQIDNKRELEASKWVMNLKGRKGVIFYEYRGQLEQLQNQFGSELFITGGMGNKAQAVIDQFVDGKDKLLIAQVNALSHGTNGLQFVCHDVLFYHPVWSRDTYEQARDRLWRQGQKNEVNCTVLSCNQSLDPLVMQRVSDNGIWMDLFEAHMKD